MENKKFTAVSTHKDGSILGHRWETLGYKPPYRLWYTEQKTYQAHFSAPVQPGSSCDYCGTGIVNVFWIKDSQEKLFKVGSDCVRHLGSDKLVVLVASEVRKITRQKRQAAERALIEKLLPDFEKALEVLSKVPHPHVYFADQGKTAADYWRYCSKNVHNLRAAIKEAKKIEEAGERSIKP